jgi:hypothetical protein
LTPPKGAAALEMTPAWKPTMPNSICSATRSSLCRRRRWSRRPLALECLPAVPSSPYLESAVNDQGMMHQQLLAQTGPAAR